MMSISSEINVKNSLLGLFIDFFIPTEVFHGLLTKELCLYAAVILSQALNLLNWEIPDQCLFQPYLCS